MEIEIDGDEIRLDGFTVARLNGEAPPSVRSRFEAAIETTPADDDLILGEGERERIAAALEKLSEDVESALTDLAASMDMFS